MSSELLAPLSAAAPRLRTGRLVLFLGVLVALCYGANLRDFFLSDDFCTLAVHRFTPGIAGVLGFEGGERAVFLRPLTELSWAFNLALGGFEPLGDHLLNAVFHLANAVLVAKLSLALGRIPAAAWIAGATFACFPLHAEAVTWANGRVDVLCTSGVLASLLCWTRYCTHEAAPRQLMGSGLFFVLALGCKEMAVTLPVLATVITLACFRDGGARLWRGLLLLYLLLLGYLLLRWLMLGGVAGYEDGQGQSLFLDSSFANGIAFLGFALKHMLLPSGSLLAGTASHALAFAAPLAWCVALLFCLGLRVPGRNLLVALCFGAMFLVSTAPVVGWVRFILGENEPWRFLYLPSAFACAGLGLTFSFLKPSSPRAARIAAGVLACLLLVSNFVGLREVNARWHAAALLSKSMVEGIRERYAREIAPRPLVHAPIARKEQGVSVFHNGFSFAVQLWVRRELQVYPSGKWRIMNLRGDPLPADPPLQLAWDSEARIWKDI